MNPLNPDEEKIQLKERTNNTPVKKRAKMSEIECCDFVNSSDCASLDFEKENVCFRYESEINGGNSNFDIKNADMSEDEDNYFTDNDILKET